MDPLASSSCGTLDDEVSMTPVLFAIALWVTAQVPANWSCDDALFDDDTCDCGCAVPDDDCDGGGFEVCVRDNCPDGQVPWADNNASCMASTCGGRRGLRRRQHRRRRRLQR
ncbi:MAG: hypothetical protein Q8O67_17335 [Deltaproteobacteria bacterium]|nr:hypothetical protein [Deltaproteobacteria bacterium]